MATQLTYPTQHLSTPSLAILLIGIGFIPVTCIVFHCLEILPLKTSLIGLIIPSVAFLFIASQINSKLGQVLLTGWAAGVVAVLAYDVSRIPFMMVGWSDFIPKIGGWVYNTNERNASIGYAWRYIGNGGGMGISFFILMHLVQSKKNLILNGIVFGWFVFLCLMCILTIFPKAQVMMFKITPLSFTGSLTGHIVYGFVLGLIYRRKQKQLA